MGASVEATRPGCKSATLLCVSYLRVGIEGMAGPRYVSVAVNCVPLLFCGFVRAGHRVSDVGVSNDDRTKVYHLTVRLLGCDYRCSIVLA